MPSFAWYMHRLRAMPPSEIRWRINAHWRDRLDARRILAGRLPSDPRVADEAAALAVPCPPKLSDLPRGAWRDAVPGSVEAVWRERLIADADAIAAHTIRIFGERRYLGHPINWNRDHERGADTPLALSCTIDYRDVEKSGDAKVVWEPNRHQHLVVLARAYRVTGDDRYAHAVVEQLDSWMAQSPFGRGMNWRSPLELAIRLINWTWAIDLIRDAGVLTVPFCERLLTAVHQHLFDVTRKYSHGSSANNHLIGEAAGVFVASGYFAGLTQAREWRDQSAAILTREIAAQIHEDGGTREQASAYHLFVLQLHLVAALTGRRLGSELPTAFWGALERMTGFVAVLAEGGDYPCYGDADDGYVLDLGRDGSDLPGSLGVGAVLFGQPEFKRLAGPVQEPLQWLLGVAGVRDYDAIPSVPVRPLASRSLAESGYYLLQRGTPGRGNDISVLFDCGPLGFGSLAAHGHADALSVTVRLGGREFLVDPGTYDYFSYPEWRAYLRGTAAHNTVAIDEVDQSTQLGLFLWGDRAEARCISWAPAPDGGVVVGEHDGYRRLSNPVGHTRSVELRGDPAVLTIRDDLAMRGPHRVRVAFHLAPGCIVRAVEPGTFEITRGAWTVRASLDARLSWAVEEGSDHMSGWVSREYHQRARAASLIGTIEAGQSVSLTSSFAFSSCPAD